jgi:hypothetical protein
MTSQVNPYNIDGTYPVAGQDNDSQGFRDNFTNTRNNFAFIKSEVEDLQQKVVLKAALNNSVLANEMDGTVLNNVQLKAVQTTFNDIGSIPSSRVISFVDGNFQRISTATPLSLTFSGWPAAGVVGKMELLLNIANNGDTITWPAASVAFLSKNLFAGFGVTDAANVTTYANTGPSANYLYEVFSTDGGVTYHINLKAVWY